MFLLYLLWSCRESLRLDLSVVTCDHGFRPESRDETREVQQRAWSLGLPCQVRRLRVPERQTGSESMEMAARRLRRDAYVETAREFQACQVALGHHKRDQAETVLLKLARGAGPRGAAGMDWISPLNADVDVVRPLLSHAPEEIREGLRLWGVTPMEDDSNQSDRFLRNRVRHEVLPLLENRLNNGVVDHLCAFADQQRKLEDWVAMEARERGKSCRVDDGLRVESWRFLPEVIRERVLLGWLRDQGADMHSLGRKPFSSLQSDLLEPVGYARRWRVGGLSIRMDRDVLSVDEHLVAPEPRMLPLQGELEWESLHRAMRVDPADCVDMTASDFKDFQGTLTAFVRPPEKGRPLVLRTPRPGDRYSPLGLKGSVKLSDLFINGRLPAKYRPVWPVVVCGDDIVWVPGFRIADPWRVERAPCLKLTLAPRDGNKTESRESRDG